MAWKLDPAHSEITFSVRHMMISKVRGHFEKFDGSFEMNETAPAESKVHVTVETTSVNTRMEQRDGHLRSPDFFDAEKYPVMTFDSTSVKVLGSNSAVLTGNLTIKDITKPVSMDVEFIGQAKSPWGTTSYGFAGHTKINRKDWNLNWNQALETGGVLVGDEIEINVELELVKVPETQPASA